MDKPVHEFKKAESHIQQAVLNVLDALNTDMIDRKIDKRLFIDAKVYNENKSVLIGVDKKEPKFTIEFKYQMQYLKKGKVQSSITLYELKRSITNVDDKELQQKEVSKALDQCFLNVMREGLGLLAILSEQKVKNNSAGHVNG